MPSQRELDHEFRLRRLQVFQTLSLAALKAIYIVGPFVMLWLSIRDLAGRQTSADVVFKALADIKLNRALARVAPWGTTTLATGWAIAERQLRKRHIQRTSSENSKMQSHFDLSRRSSRLTTEGNTSPEDV
jgi:hypothetical protein